MSAPQQQPIIETVVIKPADAPEYLAKLGITAAHLDTALDSGEVAAGNIDEFHPRPRRARCAGMKRSDSCAVD